MSGPAQGLSGQSWLSCMLTDEKLRPTLVHNGPMTTSVTLFHIVCTEGKTIRQVFTKGIRILERGEEGDTSIVNITTNNLHYQVRGLTHMLEQIQ
jgi:predicted solute-binding protein